MNKVTLIGRLTRDPELRYSADSQTAIAFFTLAVSRPGQKGKDPQTDFLPIKVFGRQAENCHSYLGKGRLVAVEGSIRTGSYRNQNGETIYTTEIVASHVQFLDFAKTSSRDGSREAAGFSDASGSQTVTYGRGGAGADARSNSGSGRSVSGRRNHIPDSFEAIDDDVPF